MIRHVVGLATAFGTSALVVGVHADVTTVSQVAVTEVIQPSLNQTVSSGAAAPQRQEIAHSTQTVTTYYKGGSARTEVAGGAVTVYDGPDDKVYTLDPLGKTYYETSFKEAVEPQVTAPGQSGTSPKVDAHIDVKDGNESKAIIGYPAKVSTVSGTITITSARSGGRRGGYGGGGGGHHRGGGGFPGGGGGGFPLFQGGGFPGGGSQYPDNGGSPEDNGGGGGYGGGARSQTLEVSGELWLSDAIRLPDDRKATDLPAIETAAYQGQLAYKPLTDSVNKNKDIPLDSRLTFTHTVRRTGAQDSVTTTTHIVSVSTGPLPDAMFRLPLGYTQVAPPPPPLPEDTPADDNGGGGNYHVTVGPGGQ